MMSRSWGSAISIRPSPIETRPISRVRAPPARNIATPASRSSGDSRETSKESACTINVVPTLAPSITASAGTRATNPAPANEAIIRPVAVLLCRIAVTPRPAAAALIRLPSAWLRKRLSSEPNARWTPLCTMWTPHKSRAIAPARLRRFSVASMDYPPCSENNAKGHVSFKFGPY